MEAGRVRDTRDASDRLQTSKRTKEVLKSAGRRDLETHSSVCHHRSLFIIRMCCHNNSSLRGAGFEGGLLCPTFLQDVTIVVQAAQHASVQSRHSSVVRVATPEPASHDRNATRMAGLNAPVSKGLERPIAAPARRVEPAGNTTRMRSICGARSFGNSAAADPQVTHTPWVQVITAALQSTRTHGPLSNKLLCG